MPEHVVIYRLTHKFVNNEQALPEGPRQVIYYSLAIGHHVGVMDCFQPMAEVPLQDYRDWLDSLPPGEAHRKMEGLLKWGEIELNRSHADLLLPVLRGTMSSTSTPPLPWVRSLVDSLLGMITEPALYLMLRKQP